MIMNEKHSGRGHPKKRMFLLSFFIVLVLTLSIFSPLLFFAPNVRADLIVTTTFDGFEYAGVNWTFTQGGRGNDADYVYEGAWSAQQRLLDMDSTSTDLSSVVWLNASLEFMVKFEAQTIITTKFNSQYGEDTITTYNTNSLGWSLDTWYPISDYVNLSEYGGAYWHVSDAYWVISIDDVGSGKLVGVDNTYVNYTDSGEVFINETTTIGLPDIHLIDYYEGTYHSGMANQADDRFMAQELQTSTYYSSIYPTGVQLYMKRVGTPGDITVSIWDSSHDVNSYGAIEDGALCSVTTNVNDMFTSYGWYWFNFTQWGATMEYGQAPILLNDDTFIVVSDGDADSSNYVGWAYDGHWFGASPYPDGVNQNFEKWHGACGQRVEEASHEEDVFIFRLYGIYATDMGVFDYYGENGVHDDRSYWVDDDDWVAQGLIPDDDLFLTSVEILAYDQGSGTFEVSLHNSTGGEPSATAWMTVDDLDIDLLHSTPNDMFIKAEFDQGVRLNEGELYFIVVSGVGLSSGFLYLRYDGTNGYEGDMFDSDNAGEDWYSMSDDILFRVYGSAPEMPTSPTISINSGEGWTNDPQVTLTLSCSDADIMQFRNEEGTWSYNQTYDTTKIWNLSGGYGQKEVEVRFWNTNGVASASDKITYSLTNMQITTIFPTNNSVEVDVLPHMYVTLVNHSTDTMLRLYAAIFENDDFPEYPKYSEWSIIGNETVSEDGVVWFNLTEGLYGGSKYQWFVELVNTTLGTTVYFPEVGNGSLIEPFDSDDPVNPWGFDPHYCWTFNTTNTTVSMDIIYPLEGESYNRADWSVNHTLWVKVSNLISHNLSIYMTVSFGEGSQTMDAVEITSESITGYEGNLFFDLRPYIPYDNMNYSITLQAYDREIYGSYILTYHRELCQISGQNTTNFTIGTHNPAKHQFALSNPSVEHGDDHALSTVTNGFSIWLASNCTKTYPELWYYIVDPSRGIPTNVIAHGRRTAETWFTNFTLGQGYFAPRHTYQVYIGVFYDGNNPGETIDWNLALTESSTIYDDIFLVGGDGYFNYEFNNDKIPKWYLIRDGQKGSGSYNGDANYYGYMIEFSTYPEGEEPIPTDPAVDTSTGSDWGAQQLAPFGIPGLEIVVGLVIIALFAICPYVLIKRKGKDVPLPVLAMFATFGSVLAYGMGFFPLWFFVIPTFLSIIIIVYKVISFITGRNSLVQSGGGQ